MKLKRTSIYRIEYYKTKQFPNKKFPICYFCDGSVSPSLIAFCKMQIEIGGGSNRALRRIIIVVARIYHFYLTQKQKHTEWQEEPTRLFLSYFSARLHGTITSKSDETGLFYQPVKYDTASNEIKCFEKFHEWCARYLNVVNDRDYIGSLTKTYTQEQKKSKFSLLAHLDDGKSKTDNSGSKWVTRQRQEFQQDNFSLNGHNYKAFPHNSIFEFIDSQTNINFKAAMLLQAFTGLRASEVLHILITDIVPKNRGGYEVIVSHPVNGNTYYPLSKQAIRRKDLLHKFAVQAKSHVGLGDTDIEFLEHMRPRVDLENKYNLEWKGMTFPNVDYNPKFGYTLNWSSDAAHREFSRLVHKLQAQARRNHPYLLITQSSGMPLTLSNYTNTFRYKSKKILTFEIGPHSLRHFCGEFCANALNMSVDQTKDILRHASVDSTNKYYKKSKQKIRSEILQLHGEGDGRDLSWEELKHKLNEGWC
ncbi:tyrosine-type recombinase/integrase [Parashewanella spongiae]|nr:tyrosine-type recombinase/integrase [Parashewanella spongiae]